MATMVYSTKLKSNVNEPKMPLDDAPKHIKLAVDLIEILEENQIDEKTAIKALKIVLDDYKAKLAQKEGLD